MSTQCLFCRIVEGAIPSHKVHEDARAFAFLDINPLARGHALVIPKRHAIRLRDLSPDDVAGVFGAVHQLTPRLEAAVGASGATIAINDGSDAGQEIPHVHVHIVPRRQGDGFGPIHALFARRAPVAKDDLAQLAQRLRGEQVQN